MKDFVPATWGSVLAWSLCGVAWAPAIANQDKVGMALVAVSTVLALVGTYNVLRSD